jgi:hypothetical protein
VKVEVGVSEVMVENLEMRLMGEFGKGRLGRDQLLQRVSQSIKQNKLINKTC